MGCCVNIDYEQSKLNSKPLPRVHTALCPRTMGVPLPALSVSEWTFHLLCPADNLSISATKSCNYSQRKLLKNSYFGELFAV